MNSPKQVLKKNRMYSKKNVALRSLRMSAILLFLVLILDDGLLMDDVKVLKAADETKKQKDQTSTSKDGAVCKNLGGDMENGFKTRCIYKNKELKAAYESFIQTDEDGKYLQKQIPQSDLTKGEDPTVEYKWQQKSKLSVTLTFPGGVTTIRFEEKGKNTEILKHMSPD
ncbi:hypothetical protein HGB47_18835 [Leptospira yasudae]|uniref:hypothetical protein n=1 Tax=Leptospira yasudae TaxID=2202201 RepID=UPI001C4FBAF1|nr:hypothetical protein [Leptospira yasudae]MBW0435665.1 hypothetical protein [Leptospira yasudae]